MMQRERYTLNLSSSVRRGSISSHCTTPRKANTMSFPERKSSNIRLTQKSLIIERRLANWTHNATHWPADVIKSGWNRSKHALIDFGGKRLALSEDANAVLAGNMERIRKLDI